MVCGVKSMKNIHEKTGIGMYTVYKEIQKDMYGAFCRLGDMGYRGVEFYGEPTFDLKLVEKSLKDSKMILAGWHIEWKNLQEKFADTVRYLQAAGCPLAVIPCLGGKWQVAHGPKEECKEIWLRYIEEINQISEKLKKEGIRTGYHNHEHEFLLSYDGKRVFDILFDGLSEDIIIELDSGNCIEGGDNPMRVLRKYQKREFFLHMKPFSCTKGFNTILGAEDDVNDWKRILDSDGKEFLWLLVESENEKLSEMENAELCMHGLKKYM